jgi:hypothetical protein
LTGKTYILQGFFLFCQLLNCQLNKKENHITGPDEHIEKRLLAQLTGPVDAHAETGLLTLKAFYCLEAAILSSFFLHLSPNHQLERKKICVTMKWVLSP